MPTDKKKVLIVEDDVALLKGLSDKFSAEGYEVIQAQDGATGLELALSAKPDMILLDIVMPKMDGITMLNKLRAKETPPYTPVLMLTNLGDEKDIQKAMEGGAFDFLIKADWRLEDVVKKVKKRLEEPS